MTHVLIIPSEEFIPRDNHLLGIFQKHQAKALQAAGCKVGVLSIVQSLTIPMIVKAMFFKLARIPITNELKFVSFTNLFYLLYNKIFNLSKFINYDKVDGLETLRIAGFYFFSNNKHTNHFGWLMAGEKAWEKYCDKYGVPDIIHAHNALYAGMLANRISKTSKIPYVITEHSTFLANKLESRFLDNAIIKSYQEASTFYVVSPSLGEKINLNYNSTLHWQVLSNVLDPDFEQEPIHLNNKLSGIFRFISIGSLINRKRHSDVIKAFNLAFNISNSEELIISGDGELELQLQKEVDELKLNNRVHFVGRLGRREVIKYIDQSDCLVLASEYETFGVVLIEALSRGKPVISSKSGGPETIVNEQNGFLYPIGDIKDLAYKMKAMKEDYNRFNKERIRFEANSTYGSISFGNNLKNAYLKILAKNG